jgi:hypothetical protein
MISYSKPLKLLYRTFGLNHLRSFFKTGKSARKVLLPCTVRFVGELIHKRHKLRSVKMMK